MKSADVIRSAMCRAGYWRRTEKLCDIVGIPLSTWHHKMRTGGFTIPELRRLDMALHFNDKECEELIRGK